MHVAQFVHRYPPALGGAEAYTARLSRHLLDHGHRVTVWTTTAIDLAAFTKRGLAEAAPGESIDDGVAVRRFPLSMRWPGRRAILGAASLLPLATWKSMTRPWQPISLPMWRAAKHTPGDPDLVHALAFPYASIAYSALRLARKRRVPFVVTPFLHLGDPDDPRDRIRRAYTAPHLQRLLRLADRIFVQTASEQAAVARMGIATERIVLQGLGVDPQECTGGDRLRFRSTLGIADGTVVLGHLTNLSAEKGTIDLLNAVASLRKHGLELKIILAGTAMPGFEEFWQRFEAKEFVVRLGPISDEQKRDFFAGIDVFAMPSRSDSFGLVFLEAWTNRIPVIGYRAGGVADLIRDGQDGLLIKCGAVEALANGIERLARSAELRQGMGTAGHARIGSEFQWDGKLSLVREQFEQLVRM